MKYRLYVDEVGNSDPRASSDPNHRYLSLTGAIFELDYVHTTLFPAAEDLKRRYFQSHPDEPVILHRMGGGVNGHRKRQKAPKGLEGTKPSTSSGTGLP